MTTVLDEVRETSNPPEVIPSPPDVQDTQTTSKTEEVYKVSGEALWHKLKELIHQGNIRRILIKNESGHLLLELPMTAGVLGGVASIALFPEIVAIGVIGSMFAHLTLSVERRVPPSEKPPDSN